MRNEDLRTVRCSRLELCTYRSISPCYYSRVVPEEEYFLYARAVQECTRFDGLYTQRQQYHVEARTVFIRIGADTGNGITVMNIICFFRDHQRSLKRSRIDRIYLCVVRKYFRLFPCIRSIGHFIDTGGHLIMEEELFSCARQRVHRRDHTCVCRPSCSRLISIYRIGLHIDMVQIRVTIKSVGTQYRRFFGPKFEDGHQFAVLKGRITDGIQYRAIQTNLVHTDTAVESVCSDLSQMFTSIIAH